MKLSASTNKSPAFSTLSAARFTALAAIIATVLVAVTFPCKSKAAALLILMLSAFKVSTEISVAVEVNAKMPAAFTVLPAARLIPAPLKLTSEVLVSKVTASAVMSPAPADNTIAFAAVIAAFTAIPLLVAISISAASTEPLKVAAPDATSTSKVSVTSTAAKLAADSTSITADLADTS